MDQRIEEWGTASPKRNFIELIGPRDAIYTDNSLGDKDILRWFDPTAGDIIFWGNELSVPVTLDEARRILPLAIAESKKASLGARRPPVVALFGQQSSPLYCRHSAG